MSNVIGASPPPMSVGSIFDAVSTRSGRITFFGGAIGFLAAQLAGLMAPAALYPIIFAGATAALIAVLAEYRCRRSFGPVSAAIETVGAGGDYA